jgi:hypothetical protein
VFPETNEEVTFGFKILALQNNTGRIEFEVLDMQGKRPVRLVFDNSGKITARNGGSNPQVGSYQPHTWYQVKIALDVQAQQYDLSIAGNEVLTNASFAESVASVERLEFRTGQYRLQDSVPRILDDDVSNANSLTTPAVFKIDNVSTSDFNESDLNEDGVTNFLDLSIFSAEKDVGL